MCRVFGAVTATPISIKHELVESPNPMVRQSEDHDSGWGVAAYRDLETIPVIERFPLPAYSDPRFMAATRLEGRIFNAHVRRATLGAIGQENTHPFDLGPYTFSHNGTILEYHSLLRRGMSSPKGQTDSECFFLRLMNEFDPDHPVRSMRGVVATIVATTTFSGLNFVFSDGVKLYAYKLGVFPLYWLTRTGISMVSSEQLTHEQWHRVQDDVLLTLDPQRSDEVRTERLIGDMLLEHAKIERLEPAAELKGEQRSKFAADWADSLGRSTTGARVVPSSQRLAGEPATSA